MCGICGYVNLDGRPVADNSILKRMTDALTHRGPDDEGYYIDGNAALGHRRLSIIDLKTGHQPISDDSGDLSIVYNGEIYNFIELKTELINNGYNFSTRSDTEVALKSYLHWGDGCLDRFNGMFSLAIWNARERNLFLARDRFGKKPLYYAVFNSTFIFASELKAIYLHPEVKMEIDRLALAKYFAHDYIPAPRTIIQGISKLEAGHYLVVKDGAVKNKKYWDFRFQYESHGKTNPGLLKQEFLGILKESVRKRLISDVPLGVFLSGGIDSSAVVAMMSQLMDPGDIKTFSIGFKEKSYNEADSADLVAKHFKTDHREKIIDADMMLDALPDIIEKIDEPFADSSIIPTYMVSQFTREHVKVALGGDGGDELFMGYPSFIAHRIAGIYDLMPSFCKRGFNRIRNILPGKSSYMSLRFKADRFMRGMDYPVDQRHQVWIGSFPPNEQKSLFSDLSDASIFDPANIYSESVEHFSHYPDIPIIDKIEYLYIKTYLVDDILTKVDRASMAVSLEVRAPFLDREMADFSGRLPNNLKLRGLTTKYLMKEALRGILPESIIRKPKHGFAVPVGSWFSSRLKELLLETLNKKTIEGEGIIQYNYVKKLMDDHFTGRIDNGRKIWALFIYQMWHDKWMRK